MDEVTKALITGAVGGAAGSAASEFVKKAWHTGQKWLSSYFKDHNQKAIEKAQIDSLEILVAFAQRVHKLEEAAKASDTIKDRIVSVLEDPAFTALLKDSLLGSAKTENETIHRLLARLVSEKLQCESNNLLALTNPLACDAVQSLTDR